MVTLRTRDRLRQWVAWLATACICVALYVLGVHFFGSGDVTAFYEPEQMRFFLPVAFLFGIIAYETRWDGISRMKHVVEKSETDEYCVDATFKVLLQEAELGSVSAMETLCEQAWKRGNTVEAYFWVARAQKYGSTTAQAKMLKLRKKWMRASGPAQRSNIHDGFSEERASVARALLRIACGYDVESARQRISNLAERGQPDARLFV